MRCWILCNERTGSTLLCNLLNDTHLFPNYADPRLTERKGPLQKNRSFDEWLRLFIRDNSKKDGFLKNPPDCLKCLRKHFVKVFGQIDAKELEEFFPGVRYILLRRRNIFEHAASIYLANLSGVWHIYNQDQKDRYTRQNFYFDLNMATEAYESAMLFQNNWMSFLDGQKPIDVFYEDLIINPNKCIENILNSLGLPRVNVSISNRTLPMTRPDSYKYAEMIRQTIQETPIFL